MYRPHAAGFGIDRPIRPMDDEDINNEAAIASTGDQRSHPTTSSAGGESIVSADAQTHGGTTTSGIASVEDGNIWAGVSAAGGVGSIHSNCNDLGTEYLSRWFDLLGGYGDLVRRLYLSRTSNMQ